MTPAAPRRKRTPPKTVALLRSEDGYTDWAWDNERFLVCIRHSPERPLHVLAVATEADARAMVDRAARLHQADNSVYIVHFWRAATIVGTVVCPRDYGGNGRVGRARSNLSERRFRRERAALEGIDLKDAAASKLRRAETWARIGDDTLLTGRLKGYYSPTPGALGRAALDIDPTQD